jgi:hypothetical protein
MLHELAHTFGLPHDQRAQQVNIMGQGFRNLRWNVGSLRGVRQRAASSKTAAFSKENAWLLMASRYLNQQVDRTDNRPPKVVLDTSRTSGGIVVTVDATDESGLSTVVLLDRSESDRKMVAGQRLSGQRQTTKLLLPAAQLPNGPVRLQVLVVDTGGNMTKVMRSDL